MLRAALKSLLQHKLRLVLTLLAVVVGVAFVAGTFIFTDSLKKSFDALFDAPVPDLTITADSAFGQNPGGGPPSAGDAVPTLPQSDIAKVGAVPGVAAAYGVVSTDGALVIGSDGKVVGGESGPPARGGTFVPDPAIYPLTLTTGSAPHGPDQVALLESTAKAAGVTVGDTVRLSTPGGEVRPTVVGLVTRGISGSDGGTFVAFDLPTAQRLLLTSPDRITSVVVRAAAGVTQDEVAARVSTALGTGVKVQTGQQRSADLENQLKTAFQFIDIFLLTFALIALFVAIFLIFNTFSMLVAQRTRELALLRAVGASRGQVRRSVLAEAVVLGLIAAGLGVVGGILVSQGLRLLLKTQFNADLPNSPLVIEPRTIVWSLLVGVLVTVISAYVPARRAASVPPVAAMRDEIELPTRSLMVRTVIGTVLFAVALLTAQRGLASTDDGTRAAQLVGISALCTLVAVIALAPIVGRFVLTILGAPFSGSAVGRLARENGRRNPRRTAATASALAIGLALMTAIGVIASSTKASVADVVDTTIGADYVVFGVKFQPFPPTVYDAVKGTPGTSTVTFVRQVPIKVGGDQSILTGVEPDQITQVVDLTMVQGSLSSLGLGDVAVDDETAASAGVKVGDSVTGTFVNGTSSLVVTAIYKPAAAYQGWISSIGTLMSKGARELDSAVYIKVAPGNDPATVRSALDERLAPFPVVKLQDQASLKEQVNSQFDKVFGFIYALLALAVIVAFIGIVNTLALSVHERRREVGLLRAVGTSRPQIRRMVVLEAVLISLFGAALGVVVGLVYGALLQKVLEPQGITKLAVPGGQIGWFLALGVVGGVIAALWPAFTASRLDVLRAIASE